MNEADALLMRGNKNLVISSIILAILVNIGVIGVAAIGRIPWNLAIFAIVVLTLLVASGTYLYKKKPEGKAIRFIILFALLIPWVAIIFTRNNIVANFVIFPILVMYVCFSDVKLMIALIGITGIINFASMVRYVVESGYNTEMIGSCVIAAIISILFYLVLAKVTRENHQAISAAFDNFKKTKEASLKQEELTKAILEIVDKISGFSLEIKDIVEEIAASSETVGSAVQEIAEGASKTAEDIQSQSQSVDNIQNELENSAKLCEEMSEASLKASEVIDNGVSTVKKLEKESNEITSGSDEVALLMKELKEKSNNIADITALIGDIAGQTNLLALNASIEAARAGEVGRGFSVVAKEVGNLAEQSKEATLNIKSIVEELQEKTNKSTSMVNLLIDKNHIQNILVKETKAAFNDIKENVDNILERNSTVRSSIKGIVSANEGIVGNISSISAVAEETMANTEEAFAMSDKHVSDAKQALELVENLVETSKKFKSM